MTGTKLTVVVVLVAGALSIPLILQQQAISRARAEHAALEARLRDLPEAPSMPPAVKADDSAQRNRDELERLRAEAASLRTRISELAVQVQHATPVEAPPAGKGASSSSAAGASIRFLEARDVGQASPAALVQSFVSAMIHGDSNRLVQLMEFDPKTDPAVVQKTLQEMSQAAAQASASGTNTGFPQEIRLLAEEPGDNNGRWLLMEVVRQDGSLSRERAYFHQTDAGWKAYAGTNGQPVTQPIPNQP